VSPHVTPSLSAYLDGELPASEQASVRAHLARCEECAARLQELAELDMVAKTLPVGAPEGYFDGFPGRVTARLRSRRRAWGVPTWAWATAAALVLAVITPLTLREAPAPPAVEPEPGAALEPAAEALVAPEQQALPAPSTLDSLEEGEPRDSTPRRARRQLDTVGRLEKRESAALASVPQPAEPVVEADAAAATGGFAAAPLEAEEAVLGNELREAGAAAYVPISDAKKKSRELAQVARALPAATLSPAAATPVPGKGPSYEALLARSARSLEEARELREAWRVHAASEADAARADEARVQVIELGAAAWRLGGGPEDRTRLEADADAYLESPDARQAERVRRILAAVRPE